MNYNKSNTTLLHDIVNFFDTIFSAIYLSEVTYVISSFNLMTELQVLISDALIIPWICR